MLRVSFPRAGFGLIMATKLEGVRIRGFINENTQLPLVVTPEEHFFDPADLTILGLL